MRYFSKKLRYSIISIYLGKCMCERVLSFHVKKVQVTYHSVPLLISHVITVINLCYEINIFHESFCVLAFLFNARRRLSLITSSSCVLSFQAVKVPMPS
jgi:hypothetical protein